MSKTSKLTLTKKHARKVLEIVDQGLSNGLGEPEPCVAPSVRAFKIGLNDADWPSNEARAAGLRKLAIAQLGSDVIYEQLFATTLAELTIQRVLPIALKAAAKVHPDDGHKKALAAAAERCANEPKHDAASYAAMAAASNASAASNARAAIYASYAASDAAMAANCARHASRAAIYASYAASDAARAAASCAANCARAAALSKALQIAADIGVEALKICNSPGCKWLDLVE